MNSWSFLKPFGRSCWQKITCCSSPHTQQDWWKSSQPARCAYNNLTYWEVSQQTYVQTLLACLGVVIGHNSALTSIQIPSDTLNCLFPRNTFLPRTYYSFQVSQLAKICLKNRYFEKQIHWVPLLNDVWETSVEIIPYWLVIAIVKCQWAKILPERARAVQFV